MLRIILCCALLVLWGTQPLQAGHEKGAIIISYESVGHLTGDSLDYYVKAYGIYENMAVWPPANLTMSLSSSCSSTQTFSLPQLRINNVSSEADYCVPGTNIANSSLLAHFADTVTLPDTCADFRFYVDATGGRYMNTSNIQDNFSGNAHFYATLDNTQGPNSSPLTDTLDMILGKCTGRPLSIYGFSESDGDSVYYSLAAPARKLSGSLGAYAFYPGFSVNNQVNTTAGFNLNSQTGVLQTNLSQQGFFLITVQYEEFRPDTATAQMRKISEGRHSFLLFGSGLCATVNFNLQSEGGTPDSLVCGDKILRLQATRQLSPASLTNPGNEFLVRIGNNPLVVQSARVVQDSIVELVLNQAPPSSSHITVIADTGSDGNVLYSICGKHLDPLQDTVHFYTGPAQPVSAAFSYQRQFLQVDFDATNSQADSVLWDFGDGSGPSGSFTPQHLYAAGGNYNVRLIAFNACRDSDTLLLNVEVCDTIAAAFSYQVVSDSLYLSGSAASGAVYFEWDFGNGQSDTGQTTSHRYDTSGTYVVQLMVVNACGDTAFSSQSIQVCAPAVPDWTYTMHSTSGPGMIVDFDGTASQNVGWFEWDFGDGSTNTSSLTPRHVYATQSLAYLVTLTVVNTCGDTARLAYKLSEINLTENATPGLEVYPNPVRDVLHLSLEREGEWPTLRLWDAQGRKVLLHALRGSDRQKHLRLGHLPPGIYWLEISTNSGTHRQKIVKAP